MSCVRSPNDDHQSTSYAAVTYPAALNSTTDSDCFLYMDFLCLDIESSLSVLGESIAAWSGSRVVCHLSPKKHLAQHEARSCRLLYIVAKRTL